MFLYFDMYLLPNLGTFSVLHPCHPISVISCNMFVNNVFSFNVDKIYQSLSYCKSKSNYYSIIIPYLQSYTPEFLGPSRFFSHNVACFCLSGFSSALNFRQHFSILLLIKKFLRIGITCCLGVPLLSRFIFRT